MPFSRKKPISEGFLVGKSDFLYGFYTRFTPFYMDFTPFYMEIAHKTT